MQHNLLVLSQLNLLLSTNFEDTHSITLSVSMQVTVGEVSRTQQLIVTTREIEDPDMAFVTIQIVIRKDEVKSRYLGKLQSRETRHKLSTVLEVKSINL